MTIREKIQAREAEHRNGSSLNKAFGVVATIIVGVVQIVIALLK